jgi:hypothetical protein
MTINNKMKDYSDKNVLFKGGCYIKLEFQKFSNLKQYSTGIIIILGCDKFFKILIIMILCR